MEDIIELEVTWGRSLKIWWSFLWRSLIAIIAAMIAGGIVGAVIGFILGAIGVPVNTIRIICMPIGGIIGIAISVVPIKLILGKDFGEFRLVLLSKEADNNS